MSLVANLKFSNQLQQQHQEAPGPETLPPKAAPPPDSKQSPPPKAEKSDKKEKKEPVGKGESKTTLSGKAIPSFEERQKRAEAITKKQRGGEAEKDPKEKRASKPAKSLHPREPGSDVQKEPSSTSTEPTSEKTTSKPEDSSKTTQDESSGDDPVKLKSRIDEAAKAFEAGDIKALAKALGKGGKAGDTGHEKFAVIQRRQARLTKRETALDTREAQLTKREQTQATQFGDITALKTAYSNGQHHVAAKMWERITGDSFAVTTQKIARHTAGLSKERIAELEDKDRLERENRQLKAADESKRARQTEHATRQQALTNLGGKLKGSKVLDLEDGPELVLREIERAWERDNSTMMTPATAAQRVLQREEERARRLGYTKAELRQAETEEADDDEPPAARIGTNRSPRSESVNTEAVRRTLAGKAVPTFEERHARAMRLTEQRRGR